jgi:hypothetical protein
MNLLVLWTGSVFLSFIIIFLSNCYHLNKHNFSACVYGMGIMGQFFLVLWLIGVAYIFYA